MKTHVTTTLVIVLLLTLTVPAAASVRGGNRQFERAWAALTSKQPDKAKTHFIQSAESYEAALAEDPPSRTMLFPSTLLQAGMAFYFAGKYETAIKTFNMAQRNKDKFEWEALLFSALSSARLGDREKSLELFNQFRDALSFQQKITTETAVQLNALEENTTTLDAAAEAIEAAVNAQFADNVMKTRTPNGVTPSNERCDGAFWWRQNRRPCSFSEIKRY